MTVRSGDAVVAQLEPARRQFASRQMTTTEAGLKTLNFGQVYVAIADPTPDGAVPARLYWKPLVTLIWLGAAAMALGGGAVARRPAPSLRRGRRAKVGGALACATGAMTMRLIRLRAFVRRSRLARRRRCAVQPDEVMKDPTRWKRARALSRVNCAA